MKITGYEDLRVQRTINSIYEAFEQLICEKPYTKITVTELARRAQINKKTFYRYYETLDDLLAELQARYEQGYLELTKNYRYPRDLEKSVETFFRYSADQGEAYDRITVNATYTGIREEMINQVMGQTWGESAEFNHLDKWQKAVLFNYIVQTGLTIYQQWTSAGRKQPLAEVIKETQLLMRGGVDRYLQIGK